MSAPVDVGNVLCERSDLPKAWCGHCRTPEAFKRQPEPEPGKRGPQLLGRWFDAAWPGRCSRCKRPFRVADQIRADYPEGSGYISWECCRRARARRSK